MHSRRLLWALSAGVVATTACVLLSPLSPIAPAASTPSADARTTLAGSAPAWAATATALPTTARAAERLSDAPGTRALSFTVLLDQAADLDAVAAPIEDWLTANGLTPGDLRESAGILPVTGTVAAAEAAFDTTFGSFAAYGLTATAPDRALSTPAELTGITGLSGLVDSDALRASSATSSAVTRPATAAPAAVATAAASVDTTDCATFWGENLSSQWPDSVDVEHRSNSLCGYEPAQLRAMHDLPDEYTGAGATIAIVAAYDDPSVEANTNTYFEATGGQTFRAGQYVSHAPTNPDETRCGGSASWTEEQHLDVQAVHAMAPDADIIYWGSDDCSTTSMFTRILDAVETGDPDVISLSFGATEALDTDDDRSLLNRVLVEAAARNVSVFASTGNDGDYSDYGDHNDGADVTSPASSPYITAVGGTSVGLDADDNLVVEAGWETQTRFARNGGIIPPGFAFGSGGGESVVYDRPTWQVDALQGQPGAGRLLPDVASLGDPNTGFSVYGPRQGMTQYTTHGGTSLATPMVAAMVAIAKAATGVEVGLATPYLYALAGTDAIRDVVPASAGTFSPNGPSRDAIWPETLYLWDTKPQSLQSAPGWDNVTGLGVPVGSSFINNFGKLK
jgi:subtilase family serine protease